VAVYPNPANEKVVVSLKNNRIKHLELYNVLLQKVKSFKVNNAREKTLDVSSYEEGIYFLKINDLYTHKIILSR
jgi:hypothetical protein